MSLSKKIYSSPLRVYLILGLFALVGIYCGWNLPVSLFPNSSKPIVTVHISYGASTSESFINTYGNALESQLRQISSEGVETEKLESSYGSDSVSYYLEFKWGISPQAAKREVQTIVNSFAARFPIEVRDSMHIWNNVRNSGFFCCKFLQPNSNAKRNLRYC